jgi:glutamate racemase
VVVAAVEPLLQQGADTLVLGCTHYPFLAPIIHEVTGPDVVLVDTGQAIALELQRRLQLLSLLGNAERAGAIRFWSSGDPSQMVTQAGRLWPQPLSVDRLPEGFC